MPTTITIEEETKELLKTLKGDRDWNSFLKNLAEEYISIKREAIRKRLKELLEEETRVKRWAREY